MSNQSEPSHTRAHPVRRRLDWTGPYLAALEANGGSFKRAAAAARVSYSTVWERRQADAVFASFEDAAIARAQRVLESEAVRRAVEGTKVIRFQPKTGKIFHDLQYSDLLLLRLLEKAETGSWRQKQQVEHSGGVTFKTRAERVAALEKARAAAGVSAASQTTPQTIEPTAPPDEKVSRDLSPGAVHRRDAWRTSGRATATPVSNM